MRGNLSRRTALQAAMLGLAGCARRATSREQSATLDAERERRHVPGAVIAILRRGAGDELHELGALTRDSVLEVASLSKPVFAFAVLSEAARGAVDLDAPLAAIAPPPYRHAARDGEDRFDDARLAQVTPRMLLTHRAGLPSWSRDRPLAFVATPGSGWRYSGEGYVLLQRALEARGESLPALARRAVFEPLAMTRSTFDPSHVDAARGHDRRGQPLPSSLGAPNAATSLLSTATDYARFVRRLVDAPADDPIVAAMAAPQVNVDDELHLSWGTGLGLAAPGWLFHWGANPGFRALFVGERARGTAVVVLTNGDGGMELATRVVREQLGELPLLRFRLLYPDD